MTSPTAEEQPQRWSTGGLSRDVYLYTRPQQPLPLSSYRPFWGRIVQAVATPFGPLELTIEGELIDGKQTILVPPNNQNDILMGFRTRVIKELEGKDISAYAIDGKLHGVGVRVPEPMTGSMN